MGRWKPDAIGRLQVAAIELFDERGFDETTVAEIADRAGLTKRTFFRYFTDKREVLFVGGGALEAAFVAAAESAPAGAAPIEVVAAAIGAAGPFFDERHEFATRRKRIIAANEELQERELIKLAHLARAVADALRRRGVEDTEATLAAELGIAAFRLAFDQWATAGEVRPFEELIAGALGQLRAVAAAA